MCKKSEDPNMAPMNLAYFLERHVQVIHPMIFFITWVLSVPR